MKKAKTNNPDMKTKNLKKNSVKSCTIFARKCDFTGEGMNEGWCIGDGDMYAKYESDATKHAKEMGYDSLNEAYEDEAMYYTEWEIDVNDTYYLIRNNQLVEVNG